MRSTVSDAFEVLGPVLAPICPFAFEGLAAWTRRRRPEGATPPVEPWLIVFIDALAVRERPELRAPAEVGLEEDLEELRRLARNREVAVSSLSPGAGGIEIGPCWIAGTDEGE